MAQPKYSPDLVSEDIVTLGDAIVVVDKKVGQGC